MEAAGNQKSTNATNHFGNNCKLYYVYICLHCILTSVPRASLGRIFHKDLHLSGYYRLVRQASESHTEMKISLCCCLLIVLWMFPLLVLYNAAKMPARKHAVENKSSSHTSAHISPRPPRPLEWKQKTRTKGVGARARHRGPWSPRLGHSTARIRKVEMLCIREP